ncbi:DUF6794 domain-containing protein [uncultured Psychroserpens sp.]|uniref:DUF6794 domain-containing protein n=1 Tax=uncultured Psychroserpens sp. TaxID=255436 RepID=UPI0026114832|nr:DUF6794 domain-containing protein [uncultured Psychroserpens sp.]
MKFKCVLFLHISFVFNYSCSALPSNVPTQQPETYLEAVTYIYNLMDEDNRVYVKNVPFNDLIIFHRHWGAKIRASLNLWGGNRELLKSCAENLGSDSIHPESASQFIIEGVWKKLNADINSIDFSKLDANVYFIRILETIQLAKKNNDNRLMLSLPSWVYKQWEYWDNEERWFNLNNEAKKIIKGENELNSLALLFLSQTKENLDIVDDKLQQKLTHLEYDDIHLPEFVVNSEEKRTVSKLRSLTSQELALNCYGMLYQREFLSLDDYNQWMQLRDSNYLIRWKYASEMNTDDFERLLKMPRKFLEILILTNQYYDIDEHNSGLAYRYNSYDGIVDSLMAFTAFNNKDFDKEPYDESIKKRAYNSLDSEYNKNVMRALHMLSDIADHIPAADLYDMLSPSTIIKYETTLKTEDLLDYKYVVGFLLATQKERILAHPNSDEIFNIVKYYWDNRFISWAMQYYIAELLVQIDLDSAKTVFSPEFEKIPDHGSFTRNAIIEALIKYNFDQDKVFLYNWYWKIQEKEFLTVPREWSLMLSLLRDTNNETNALYKSIINDSRFSRQEFFEDN